MNEVVDKYVEILFSVLELVLYKLTAY